MHHRGLLDEPKTSKMCPCGHDEFKTTSTSNASTLTKATVRPCAIEYMFCCPSADSTRWNKILMQMHFHKRVLSHVRGAFALSDYEYAALSKDERYE